MKTIYKLSFLIALISLGCSTSKVTTIWRAPDIVPGKYNKIMVLGIIHDADLTLRKDMESHLVGDLYTLGYQAVSSLQEYGPKAFNNLSEDETLQQLRECSVDAIITIVLLNKEKERKYVAPDFYNTPYGFYYYQFYGYRLALDRRIYSPGYYVTSTKYFWESNFYDMSTQKLLYSVHTQSFDTENKTLMCHVYGQMIVTNMLKGNVLERRGSDQLKAF